jgi:hypothetical protein
MGKLDKLLAQAAPHLAPGEQILGAVLGLAESQLFRSSVPRMGALIATDQRVVLFVKKLGGHELGSINYSSVSSVETGKTIGGQNFKVHSSENAIEIRGVVGGDPNALVNIIRQRTAGGPSSTHAPAAPTNASTLDQQIANLAALKEQGALTPQQYDDAIARITR